MRVGFFATLVDKIQHAYGWDDETVFNLTLQRAVQMKEAIEQRMEFQAWENLKVLEWQTQCLSAMMVNTAQISQEGRESLMSDVHQMSLTGSSTKSTNPAKRKRKTYRTVDGKEIPASELSNYSYDEIDHSEEDQERIENARRRNAGKNITSFGNFA